MEEVVGGSVILSSSENLRMGLIAKPNRFPIQRPDKSLFLELFHSEPPNKSFYAKLLKFISFILPNGEYPGPRTVCPILNANYSFSCLILWGPASSSMRRVRTPNGRVFCCFLLLDSFKSPPPPPNRKNSG